MIYFKLIRWKNLLSTGNTFVEISLDTHGQTLIVGENGAGKSTILDALSFALYGKPFRKVNKGQLLNSINNRDLLVECEFVVGKTHYKIRRGVKPTVFEVYQNGLLINTDAAAADYQDMLDNKILKINHKSFSQIVVLGSASFTPFMQLNAATRREVIEDLLDISVFTTMRTLLKDMITNNKSELQDADYRIANVENLIEAEQQHQQERQQNIQGQLKEKREQKQQYATQIAAAQKQLVQLTETIQTKNKEIADRSKLQNRLAKVTQLSQQIVARQQTIESDRDFFASHDNCPTCRQGIADEHKEQAVATAAAQLQEITEGHGKLTSEMSRINVRLNEITTILEEIGNYMRESSDLNIQISTWNTVVNSVENEITALTKANKAETKKTRLKELNKEFETLKKEKISLLKNKSLFDVANVLLKDSGIKTKIIKQYVPIINKLINKYLASMDFFVNFELNESFEETIKSRYRDEFSYASFSEGEKSRIDLALLFTWRAIARLRNSSSTNLLVLDEVFDGSLDAQGNEELLKIIQTLTDNNNVFVISHKTDAYLDKFQRVLRFEKQKNFSRMIEA